MHVVYSQHIVHTHATHTVRIHIQAFRVQDEKTIFLFNFKTAFGASCAVLVVGVVMHQQVIVSAPHSPCHPPSHRHLTLSLAGGGSSSGFALIYDNQADAIKFEPKYRLFRV